MKKKRFAVIAIIIILVVLLFPIRMNLKDGGSVRYKSLVYEVTKIHQLAPALDEERVKPYIDGFEIKILGMTVYRETDEPETITFHDKTFNKSALSQETIEWLEKYNSLSKEEQLAISYIPSDLYKLCGYTTAEDMNVEETDTEFSEEVTVSGDLIPMVMVNGELYMDTGHESTVEARCGVMDGEITSTVDGSQKPTKDNESNFGTGYGYQYGSQEGLIEIYMNDKWCVFATEKALASSQLMVDPVAPVRIKNIFTGEEASLTVNEDIRVISDILSSDSWNAEGTTDCLSNIEIIINGETYKYHSDCGTFNDKVKQQYLSLDDAAKEKINAIIETHISLTATEVPAE